MPALDRITQDPAVMGGKACVRGMRVTVGMIVGQIGAGVTIEELLKDYPYLEREDVLQARSVTPHGWRKSEKSRYRVDEVSNRHEIWLRAGRHSCASQGGTQSIGPAWDRRLRPIRRLWRSQPRTTTSS